MKKRTTLSAKVIKNITWITVIMYTLMLFVIGTVAKNGIYSLQDDYITEIAHNISSSIERTMDEYLSIATILSKNESIITLFDETTSYRPMQANENADNIVKELTSIKKDFSDSIISIALLNVAQDGYFTDGGAYSDSSFSFKSRPYYSAVTTAQPYITDPYIDALTGGMIISVAYPVFSNNNNSVTGVVLLDLSLSFISDMISASGFDGTGTSFILDASNNIIASTDPSAAGSSYTNLSINDSNFLNELSKNTESIFEFEMANIDRYGLIGEVGDLGWHICTSLGVSEYQAHSNSVLRVLLAMLVFAFFGTLLAVNYTIKKSLEPLAIINNAIDEMSKGNLHHELALDSDDEIGLLADGLRTTSKTLYSYIDEIDTQLDHCSQGDFTYESSLAFVGDFSNIQKSLNNFEQLMSKTLVELTDNINQVTYGANQVAQGSQSIAQGAEEQTSEIDNLANTVTSITETVKENALNAKKANDLGSTVTEIMIESTNYMNDLLAAISQIQNASIDIERIIKTIDDIAFQTNILALNAAVEASRAGQAGKGFAVVADEVRNLAQKSTEAAQGTTSLIQNSLDAVERGVKIAQGTSESFVKVDESSRNVLELISKISNASEEQSSSIQQITEGLNQIAAVVQQNSAVSEENASVSEELSSQSNVMSNSVSHFKVKR